MTTIAGRSKEIMSMHWICLEKNKFKYMAVYKAGKSLNQWIAEHIQQDAEKEVGTLI